jgi:hypothetical protein
MSTASEPAIKSYFFGKGYTDLGATIADSWRRNLASAGEHFSKASRHFGADEKSQALIYGTAAISVVLFGTAVFLLASAVHVVVLLTFFLLIYVGFTVVYLAERGYLGCRRFFAVCPECHSKNPLPEYYCPQCGEIHRRLIPSSYGILFHVCRCGTKLPATFFMKRGELTSRCPDCEQVLDRLHLESRKAFVPIVGGPAVGKSAYLFAAVQQLIDQQAPRLGFMPSFLEAGTASEFERVQQGLAQGRPPAKTLATLPRALNLKLERSNGSPWLLYFYNPAGEAFAETEGLLLHKYQEYLSGIIFLIDPFSIPAVVAEYRDRLPAVESALAPSRLPIEDALSRILISLEQHFGLAKTACVKVPTAIVVNKLDAFDLEQRIGEPAVSARIKSSTGSANEVQVRDQLVRQQLIAWDQGDFVQQLENRFTRVRYFTCSSLGRMPDKSGRSFSPLRVLEPLMWILESGSSAFVVSQARAAA